MLRSLTRVGFIGLLGFELASAARILEFTPVYTWFGLLLTILVVVVGLELITFLLRHHWQTALHWSAWPLALASVTVDAFGDLFHFYTRWPWYDQIAHYSGALVTMVIVVSVLFAIESAHHWQHSSHVAPLFALGLSMTLSALYEIEEYLEDYFFRTNRLGDGHDTANDLLMNFLGVTTVVVAILITRYVRRRRLR